MVEGLKIMSEMAKVKANSAMTVAASWRKPDTNAMSAKRPLYPQK
jgi:hypothetical protein